MRVYNRMGSTELDFTDAVISHAEVRIEVDLAGGAVDLLLPDGASVDADDVNVVAGSVTNKSQSGSGFPRFVITGSVTAGALTLRKPKYVRIGNMVVRRPWKVSWES
ncbi:LiaF domain-containing protein [Actinokineospora soli]|uniref:LiaF domain-containing protein n=1 Tax=Actinokineospora soli TaxID=1048753 RepID=A0ABW2U0Y3_9PSEU